MLSQSVSLVCQCQCGEQPSEALELSALPTRPASSQLTSSEWSQANRAGGFSRSALSETELLPSLFVTTGRERKPAGEGLAELLRGTIATLGPLDLLTRGLRSSSSWHCFNNFNSFEKVLTKF